MNQVQVTILTDPMPWAREFFLETTRRVARKLRNIFFNSKQIKGSRYRGHFAVTRSLVEGLKEISVKCNYNPYHPGELADVVIVLAGVRTLRQAIRLKQRGKIKKLYAGPNIVTFASDFNFIVASPEVDYYILNSDWTLKLYNHDCPALEGRCVIWPAGVDVGYWTPNTKRVRGDILIYDKLEDDKRGQITQYAGYLRGLGWIVRVIQYGAFSHGEYLKMLQGASLMLGFSACESQGIAWAEAWSCDVPTLILKNTVKVDLGRRFECSTAPYLKEQNGLFFENMEDFKSKFSYWENHREKFTPRKWVLENMSDQVCAGLLHQHIVATANK